MAALSYISNHMKQYKPLILKDNLAPTLARRIFQLRELRNLTVRDLARESRFSRQRLEDLEAGLETWLSVTDRQVLARALGVEPALLQEVEYRPAKNENDSAMFDQTQVHELVNAILSGQRDLACPDCGATLKCGIQEGLDMEELPIVFAKAFCRKCPFILR